MHKVVKTNDTEEAIEKGYLNPFEPRGLRLDSSNNATDFASKFLQDSRSYVTAKLGTSADRYEKGKMWLACEFEHRFGTEPRKLKLLFSAIPGKISEAPWTSKFDTESTIQRKLGQVTFEVKRQLMLVGSTDLAHRVEKVIPSAVWLELTDDVVGKPAIDALTLVREGGGDFAYIFGERKIAIPLLCPQLNRAAIDGLVQSVAKIVHDIGARIPEPWGDFIRHAKLDYILSSLGISLLDWDASALFNESSAPDAQILNVFYSPFDEELRTFEGVSEIVHGT